MASHPLPLDKLAVYYGWPIAVNGTWSVSGATAVFDAYDQVVFGAGLEDSSHQEYQSTKDIIDGSTADVFGYVDSTLDLSVVQTKIDNWAVMGGTTKKIVGIFFDQFGFDFEINRQHQNDIVDYAHSKSLLVFVNAWDPDDVFKKAQGKDHHLNSGDWYLAESHYVKAGTWQTISEWETKSDKIKSYKSSGVKMGCVTTTTAAAGFSQDKWDNAHYAHSVYSFDSSGWGEVYFSAGDAQLPFRTRPAIEGTKTVGSMTKLSGVFEQKTNIGIHLNTTNHTYSEELD